MKKLYTILIILLCASLSSCQLLEQAWNRKMAPAKYADAAERLSKALVKVAELETQVLQLKLQALKDAQAGREKR